MAKTVDWKGSRSHYTGELNGVKLEIQKVPGKCEYSVFVDGVKKGWKYTLNNAKTFAIRCAEGRIKPTPSVVTSEMTLEEEQEQCEFYAAEAEKFAAENPMPGLEPPPEQIDLPMIPVAEVPTFHVNLSMSYIGETKDPEKLKKELQFHIDAIRALGGEIEAELEVTHKSKIKL